MAYFVFCEVAWMKYYAGVTEDDTPMNGGSYIAEYGEGGEVFNFMPFNHKCYGYVMHQGDELHLERLDKKLRTAPEAKNVTVVWVATDGAGCKIVGWYENAVAYRLPQQLTDIDGYHYWYHFTADEKNCWLIAENDRTFTVPRATVEGKGRGMGRSQVWYADSAYAQTEFIPRVQAYLAKVKDRCAPFYLTKELLRKKAGDGGETATVLLRKAQREKAPEDAVLYLNLAVAKEDGFKTRTARGRFFMDCRLLDEARDDLQAALYYTADADVMLDLMVVEETLGHTAQAILLGEKLRRRKSELANWPLCAEVLAWLYVNAGEVKFAKALIDECRAELEAKAHRAWIANLTALAPDVER